MATVAIKIAGTDLASSIVYASCYFMSAVNGVAGEARFRLRDPNRTLTVVPGSTVELLIDGEPAWYGFVTAPKRTYAFPAVKVTDAWSETRFIDVECADINVLFQKRIAFDQGTPENVLSPLYGPHTADTDAITDLIADWLDLSGDGLDTSSGVVGVADINEDQDARPWSGSDTWGQAMSSIALLPAAIFYLRPNKELAYVDTDTPDAPFGLSDRPDGTTSKGYREMEILLDGSNLANDVMCWGVGYGSSVPVFVRAEDSTSQSEHGLWQLGQVTYGIYKQATIDRVADSILNGSPEHHRGAKDDRPAVTVTTYEPGLLPAQKVTFESQVFDWSDVIPIRKMEITFEAPDVPKYELTLSHEIDTPWSFFDPWKFRLPNLPRLPPIPNIGLPGIGDPGGCECGITDSFTRTVSAGWGTSDSTIPWDDGADPHYSVNGTQGLITMDSDDDAGTIFFEYSGAPAQANILLTDLTLDVDNDDSGFDPEFAIVVGGYNRLSFFMGQPDHNNTWGFVGNTFVTFSGSGPFNVRIQADLTGARARLWAVADPEPSGWEVTASADSGFTNDFIDLFARDRVISTGHPFVVTLGGLDISGLNRCSEYRFDNFNRTVSNGWGTSDFGTPWTVSGTAADFSTNGSRAQIAFASGTQNIIVSGATDPWRNDEWTMTTLFRTSINLSSGSYTIETRLTGASRSCYLNFATGAGVGSVEMEGVGHSVSYTWLAGTWYYQKLYYNKTTGELSVTVWLATDPEPSTPTLTNTNGAGDADMTDFRFVGRFASGATFTHLFEWLDFDYDGKPCYEICVTSAWTALDNFNRTVGSGWGTATNGNNWAKTVVSNGPTTESVDGSSGVMVVTTPSGQSISDMILVTAAYGTGRSVVTSWWHLSFTGDPRGPSSGGPSDHIQGGIYNSAFSRGLIWSTDVLTGASVRWGRPGVTQLMLNGSGGTFLYPTSGAGFNIKVQADFTAGEIRGKAWADTDTEPASFNTATLTIGTLTASEFARVLFRGQSISGNPTFKVDFVQVDVPVTICTPVDPSAPQPGGPLNGSFCALATRTDSTHYQWPRAFIPLSSQVYVGDPGLLVRRGITLDYTEDPEAGVIIFNDPVTDGTRVYVCAIANGTIAP